MAVDVSIFSAVMSMSGSSEGNVGSIDFCELTESVSGRYHYLDWEKAEKSARCFSGDSEMKKAVSVYTMPSSSSFRLRVCKSPAIIVDRRKLKAFGFVFKTNTKEGELFLLNDNLIAFRLNETAADNYGSMDDFRRYKGVVDKINASLEPLCARLSRKAFSLPGMWHDFNADEIRFIIERLIIAQPLGRSAGEENPPCLQPVEGVSLEPYLDAMVKAGYLEMVGKNRYQRTREISDQAVVLFAYLLNYKLVKGYDLASDSEKKVLKKWYEERSWCGEKPGGHDEGFSALEEWRREPGTTTLVVKEKDKTKVKIEVSETRTTRVSYFSKLLSIPERKLTKDKSAAIKEVDSGITGKRAKVLEAFSKVENEMSKDK